MAILALASGGLSLSGLSHIVKAAIAFAAAGKPPASEVRINARPMAQLEGAIDLMVLPIAAGENTIEISPVVTPIRTISNIVSAISLVLTFVIAIGLGLRRRQSDSSPLRSDFNKIYDIDGPGSIFSV